MALFPSIFFAHVGLLCGIVLDRAKREGCCKYTNSAFSALLVSQLRLLLTMTPNGHFAF